MLIQAIIPYLSFFILQRNQLNLNHYINNPNNMECVMNDLKVSIERLKKQIAEIQEIVDNLIKTLESGPTINKDHSQ